MNILQISYNYVQSFKIKCQQFLIFFHKYQERKIFALFYFCCHWNGSFFLFSSWMLLQRMKSSYYFILFISFHYCAFQFIHFCIFMLQMKIVFVFNLYRILLLVDFILFSCAWEKNYAYQAEKLLFPAINIS